MILQWIMQKKCCFVLYVVIFRKYTDKVSTYLFNCTSTSENRILINKPCGNICVFWVFFFSLFSLLLSTRKEHWSSGNRGVQLYLHPLNPIHKIVTRAVLSKAPKLCVVHTFQEVCEHSYIIPSPCSMCHLRSGSCFPHSVFLTLHMPL